MVTTKKYLKGARKYQQEAISHSKLWPHILQEPKKKGGGGRQWERASLSSLQSNIH